MSKENYKLTGYVPSAIYNRLVEFQKNRGLKSLSQALTTALAEYLVEFSPSSKGQEEREQKEREQKEREQEEREQREADQGNLANLETTLVTHSQQLLQLNQQLLATIQRVEHIETLLHIAMQPAESEETTPGANQSQRDLYESEEAATVYPILAVHWPELLDALSAMQQRLIPGESLITKKESQTNLKTELNNTKTISNSSTNLDQNQHLDQQIAAEDISNQT